jgi:RING-box protein 1
MSKFDLVNWQPIVNWKYTADNNMCIICRSNIMDLCIECTTSTNQDNIMNCKQSFGECGHVFHSHCISKWIKINKTCPIHQTEWKYCIEHNI